MRRYVFLCLILICELSQARLQAESTWPPVGLTADGDTVVLYNYPNYTARLIVLVDESAPSEQLQCLVDQIDELAGFHYFEFWVMLPTCYDPRQLQSRADKLRQRIGRNVNVLFDIELLSKGMRRKLGRRKLARVFDMFDVKVTPTLVMTSPSMYSMAMAWEPAELFPDPSLGEVEDLAEALWWHDKLEIQNRRKRENASRK